MARKARPDRERVADDVEAALAREIAHLNAVTSQMSQKLGVVDKELSALDMAALTLEDNIVDKEAALSVDERMVLLDGRINLSTGPPSSIVTVGDIYVRIGCFVLTHMNVMNPRLISPLLLPCRVPPRPA
jgi:hypothetical protein